MRLQFLRRDRLLLAEDFFRVVTRQIAVQGLVAGQVPRGESGLLLHVEHGFFVLLGLVKTA